MKWQKVRKYMTNNLDRKPEHHENNAAKYNHRRKEATSVAVDRQVYHLATHTESINQTVPPIAAQ